MIRQLPLRAAAAAPSRLLAIPAFRPSPFFTTARFLTTEAHTTDQTPTAPPPASEAVASTAAPPAPVPCRLSYLVERTVSGFLPVYNAKRSGGTRKETVIRKIAGNVQDLKKDILADFKFKKDDVNINPVTGHIRIKVSPCDADHAPACLRSHQLNYSAGSSLGRHQEVACGTRTLVLGT